MQKHAPHSQAKPAAQKLLVLDTAFTLEMIRERGLEESVTCRDLGGFFEHVWSVHPFATYLTSDAWTPRYGTFVTHRIDPRHSFIEGKVGRFRWLKGFFALNFLLSQAALFLHLARLIRREGITIIRSGDPLYLGLFGWALARLTGIAFALRINADNDEYFLVTGLPVTPRLFRSRKVEKRIERFVLSRADLVAAPNQANLRFAVANGASPEVCTEFPYGNLLDRRHFEGPASRAIDEDALAELGLERKKFILYVGRLESGKRPDDVVKVLAELRRRGHDIKAVLVGDGKERENVRALAEQCGVSDHVVLAGNRPQGWLASIVPQAAAVASPVTGRALSEAALGGAAIVAYDRDWQGELIRTGETGALVPFPDWMAMANAIEHFLTDPDHADSVGKAVRRVAMQMFDPDRLNAHERAQYLALSERLALSSKRTRPH